MKIYSKHMSISNDTKKDIMDFGTFKYIIEFKNIQSGYDSLCTLDATGKSPVCEVIQRPQHTFRL